MRGKISEVREIADDLPDLTEQQMRFVEGMLAGKSGTDAYKAAYDCSNSLPKTIWAEASRVRNNPDVAAWICAAKIAGFGRIVRTKEERIARMERLVEIGLKTGNLGAAVQAEINAGKLEGHFTEKLDVIVNDIADELRELAKVSPELAKAYADEKGVTWQ